jgi:hypothetical protein
LGVPVSSILVFTTVPLGKKTGSMTWPV